MRIERYLKQCGPVLLVHRPRPMYGLYLSDIVVCSHYKA